MRRCAIATAVLLTGILGSPAEGRGQTPQFTFVIPVQLTNLHEAVQTAGVRCNLYRATDQLPALALGAPIGLARPCPTCPPNDFSDNVTVQGSLPAGSPIRPEEISRYDCNLELNNGFPRQTTDPRTPIELQAQTGTPFTGMVQGRIP